MKIIHILTVFCRIDLGARPPRRPVPPPTGDVARGEGGKGGGQQQPVSHQLQLQQQHAGTSPKSKVFKVVKRCGGNCYAKTGAEGQQQQQQLQQQHVRRRRQQPQAQQTFIPSHLAAVIRAKAAAKAAAADQVKGFTNDCKKD